MNITTLKKVLPFLNEAKISSFIWGLHGKGKSETIESYYKSNGWLCFNFRLNCMADAGDFLGLQDFVTDAKGNKIATKFCMPDWLKQCIDFCKANPNNRACIFIDEINRAARFDLIGPIFQMALDRKLHTFDFSDLNIDVICAANPDTGNYSVLSLEDKALLSRFCHIYFNPTKKEFFDYAKKIKADEAVLEFLQEQPDFLEEKDLETFSISSYAKPDRRKWIRGVCKLKELQLPKEDQEEVFAGLVGIEATIAFEKFLQKVDKPITLEEILDKYSKVRKKVIEYSNNEMRTDILNNTCAKVIEFFEKNSDFTEKQGNNVIKFLEDLPNELMYNVIHNIYNKRKFHEFCERNYTSSLKNLEERLKNIRQTVDPIKE